MATMRSIAIVWLALIAGFAQAEQVDPKEQLAAYEEALMRANRCIDTYGNLQAASQKLAEANQRIAALQRQLAEQAPKDPAKK